MGNFRYLFEKRKKKFTFQKPIKGRLQNKAGKELEGAFFHPIEDDGTDKVFFYSPRSNTIIITDEYFSKIFFERSSRSIENSKEIFTDWMNGL